MTAGDLLTSSVETSTTVRKEIAVGNNFDDQPMYNHPDNPLVATVRCPECRAVAGEICIDRVCSRSGVHRRRWDAARSETTRGERCQDCRFVMVQSGKIDDVKKDPFRGSYRPIELPKYYCRRYPPRRSLGDNHHLAQVDPLGWCGEWVPFLRLYGDGPGQEQRQLDQAR